MSDISEFRNILNQLNTVKPPGVSGSRIRRIADFAIKNPSLYQDVILALKEYALKSTVSRKLGVTYVIDAVARAYQDEAKREPQTKEFTSALEEIRSTMPEFIKNMEIRRQSTGQFIKMRKMLDIWAKAGTFDDDMLNGFRKDYFYEPYTTTPPGSPPAEWGGIPEDEPVKVTPKVEEKPDAGALLGVLQNLAKSKPTSVASNSSASNNSNKSSSNSTGTTSLLDQLMSQTQNLQSAASNPIDKINQENSVTSSYQRGRDAAKAGALDRNRSRSPSRQNSADVNAYQPKSRKGDESRGLTRDESLMPDRIKIISRTIYVANVGDMYDQVSLRKEMEEIAPLQSLIVNRDKRHAFAKVYKREDADAIRKEYEKRNYENKSVLKMRWGVGFGPRDCFDYSTGYSIIPCVRLTEFDRKWAMSSEYGGTGGLPVEPGQVMQEPDVDVGTSGLGARSMHRQNPMMMGMPNMPNMMGMPGMTPNMPGMGIPGMPMMGLPGMPGMPSMPNLPGMNGMPNIPDMQNLPNVPNIPGGPPIPGMPGIPNIPSLPNMPGMPNMPNMPGMPVIPGMPSMPNMNQMPGMQGMSMMGPAGSNVDMQQFFSNMQQQMQQQQSQPK